MTTKVCDVCGGSEFIGIDINRKYNGCIDLSKQCINCGKIYIDVEILSTKRNFCYIGLDNPKCQANIGSAMRAVGCFDADGLLYSGKRVSSSGLKTDPQKFVRQVPLINVESVIESIPHGVNTCSGRSSTRCNFIS